MVAVIDTGDISDLLAYRRLIKDKQETYSVAWRSEDWQGAKSHLALLLDDEKRIRWIGRARGRKRVSDRERRVKITEIVEFGGMSIEELRNRLPDRHKSGLRLGILTDAVGREVLNALISTYPDSADLLYRLNRDDNIHLPTGNRGLILNEQRDGTGLLLEISGIDRDALNDWAPSEDLPSFLAGTAQRSVSEETLINHDLARFPELVSGNSGHADWRLFGNNQRRLFVLNANMEPLEETLGVDVVYFNKTFRSFVLIQYKRLTKENNQEGSSKAWYRPDANLQKELDRMKKVDEIYGARSGDFRLFGQACWLKLCDSSARIENSVDLIKGMYLAREYFLELLDTCKGPRGGVRLGYDNVPRHINNTTFAQLIKDGWIGTRNTDTSDLESIIEEVLFSRRAITLGIPLPATRT